ncbi:glycosyltransferase family 2 protein [Stutzerimonas stutzeri]|uniref:glycosyltransferase family 2 protein n=1 Tax=Stutzerimonas stutzeri TaxID=316 RepID=UPI00265819F7|nr:glycosyltransferase [Stutzerimonas stutzeri]MCF6781779.1 glycosyltransferase [Stutzerimonas stutzeri]MCF6804448.1 glycosyltransferase [Stutzerimonas stutzeri]
MSVLVSIVMPVHNSERFLGESVSSVIAQLFCNWELILIDDCSSDDSLRIASSCAEKDRRIKVVMLGENSGAAVARNKGIELAQGRYIAFLDSDDLWTPNKLGDQIAFMQDNDVAFCYSAYEKLDEVGNRFGVISVPQRVSYKDLLKVSSIGCLTAIYDTRHLGKIYMPLIRKRQDLGLWLKILKKIPYAYAAPGVLAKYRVRSDSISADKFSAAKYTWKLYRNVEQLGFFDASYYFMHYAMNGFLRTKLPGLARAIGILK